MAETDTHMVCFKCTQMVFLQGTDTHKWFSSTEYNVYSYEEKFVFVLGKLSIPIQAVHSPQYFHLKCYSLLAKMATTTHSDLAMSTQSPI